MAVRVERQRVGGRSRDFGADTGRYGNWDRGADPADSFHVHPSAPDFTWLSILDLVAWSSPPLTSAAGAPGAPPCTLGNVHLNTSNGQYYSCISDGVGGTIWVTRATLDPTAWGVSPLTLNGVFGALRIQENVVSAPVLWPYLQSSASASWCNLPTWAGGFGASTNYSGLIVHAGSLMSGSGSVGVCSIGNETWPAGTQKPVSVAATYVNAPADLTLVGGFGNGPDGKLTGANIPGVNAMTAGIETGAYNAALDFSLHRIARSAAGQLTIEGVAPSVSTCTVSVSTFRDFSSTVGTPATTQTGRAISSTVTGIGAGLRYVRLECPVAGGTIWDDKEIVL